MKRHNKAALTNPLPLLGRSRRAKRSIYLIRSGAPSSGWQTFGVLPTERIREE